jgi:hypothetical protein
MNINWENVIDTDVLNSLSIAELTLIEKMFSKDDENVSTD